MRRPTLLLLTICTVPLLCTACGGSSDNIAEKAIEKATGGTATVDSKNGTTKVTTSEGTVTYGAQELPADWPKDVPVYPGATVQMAGTIAEGSRGVILATQDAKANIVTYYQSELQKQGWKTSAAVDMGPVSIIGASKDARNLALQIATNDGKTSITISLEEKAQK